MYFQGIDAPDTEPRRNKYASAKQKSKFTEKVAGTVVDGDLYFSMRAPSHQRFFVPVEPGEHGIPEDADGTLLCVTHVFTKPFPDLRGRWQEYDGGGNLVIKVRSTGDDEIVYAAMQAIEQALYRTQLGRAVGRDALRSMAESLCKTFGIDREDAFVRYGESKSQFTVDAQAEALAKHALRELLTFAPEGGYDDALGEIGAEADGVGFAENAEEYANLINGDSNGFGEALPTDRQGKPLPLLSQPVFYAVLGYKGEGRGFQSRIDTLCEAVGLDPEDI